MTYHENPEINEIIARYWAFKRRYPEYKEPFAIGKKLYIEHDYIAVKEWLDQSESYALQEWINKQVGVFFRNPYAKDNVKRIE